MKEYEQKIHNIINNAEEDVIIQAHQAFEQGYEDGKELLVNTYVMGKGGGILEAIKKAEYNRGLNEAWEAAKKLCQSVKYGGLEEYCNEIFEKTPFETFDVFDYTASEAIAKIKEYEDKQDAEIKVGDEVVYRDGIKGIVVGISNIAGQISVLNNEYDVPQLIVKNRAKKTGRTFSQIAEILSELRGAKNADVTD